MNRQVAIFLSMFISILFVLLFFFGAKIKLWSSIVLSIFIGLIILNIFYPINRLTFDAPDLSLIIYAIIQIIGIFILGFYIFERGFNDLKQDNI